jgi:hypothetical protein
MKIKSYSSHTLTRGNTVVLKNAVYQKIIEYVEQSPEVQFYINNKTSICYGMNKYGHPTYDWTHNK